MAIKVGVIEQIGESGLFLPELINLGLGARERLKYYVALLQAAHLFAEAPSHPAPTLRGEREASGIADPEFDEIISTSRALGGNVIRIPGARIILQHIFGDALLQTGCTGVALTHV